MTPRMPPAGSRVRRWLVRAVPTFTVVTVAVSGLAAPTPKAKPVLESRVQTLAAGVAGPGWQKAVRTALPTELVGFEWTGTRRAELAVRSKVNGRWGEWLDLDSTGEEGPDSDAREYRGRATAGPAFVGKGVRDVQVRVTEGNLRNLRLHAIHSEDPRPAGGIASAGAAAPQPSIITRAGWGADESLRRSAQGCTGNPDYASRVRYSVVHHTASHRLQLYGPGDSASIVRGRSTTSTPTPTGGATSATTSSSTATARSSRAASAAWTAP